MRWRYRSILFEYRKDGLLGDRYIDDEEMLADLNEQGSLGWELVGVSPVQDGLLAFFKKPEGRGVVRESSAPSTGPRQQGVQAPAGAKNEGREPGTAKTGRGLEDEPGEDRDEVGGIRIS